MSRFKRLFAVACLCVMTTVAWAEGSASSTPERNAGKGRDDVVDLLMKRQYYFLADNLLTEGTPTRQRPGIGPIWTWPSGPWRRSAIAAELQLWSGEKQLPVELDESASQWRPHRLHTEYAFPGGRLAQDVCIADDTVVCKLTVHGAPDAQVRVVGEPAGESGAEEPAILDGMAVLKNQGSLAGVWQVVAAPGKPVFDGTRYEFRFAAQPQIVLAATLSRDRGRAIARVRKAMDDPDAAFQRARQRWADFFSAQIPAFDCSDASLVELYYWIAYVLEANAYRNLGDPHWPYAYVTPSKWEWRGIWPEDLSHCLTGLRWFNDPALANDCLRTLHHLYVPDRSKNLMTRPMKEFNPKEAPRDVKVHAYGFTTLAAWAVFLKTGEVEFLREIFPGMCVMNRFESDVRDDDRDGLTSMFQSFQVGGERSPRFDFGENYADADRRWFKRPLEIVDANTYYLRQSQILARVAKILGEEKIAGEMSARADKTKEAMARKMWDEETGFFYDLFADNDEFSKVKCCTGFFPLLAGAASPDRARRLVAHLVNPAEFWPAYPVPWLPRDERAVKAGGWQREGATNLDIRNNWLIVEGLARCGFDEEARELIWRTLKLLRLQGPNRVETGYYYEPDTGRPTSKDLNTLFSTPVAGVFDFLLCRVAGVDPMEGQLIRFRPMALDANLSHLTVSGLRYKGHEIGIQWSGVGNKTYRALVDGKPVFETSDPHRVNVVYDLAEKRVVKTAASMDLAD